MAVFLYVVCFTMIFLCAFGLPFATKRMPVALAFLAASIALFFGGLWMSEFARQGPPLNFVAVLCLSVLPFAAGALARVITLQFFADKEKEWVYVLGVGVVTTALFFGLGYATFGLVA
jgi:hypothetical protein